MTSASQQQIPADFVCPLTKQVMKDPVMSKYGYHFERSAILQHLDSGDNFCPITGNPLRPSNLVSNKTLQWKIKYWAKKNGMDIDIGKTTADEESSDCQKSVGFVAVPPARFHCPLSNKVMQDPVMTKEGINFERKAILKWLDSSCEELCPVTSEPLSRRGLVSNSKLQWEIEQWQQKYGMENKVEPASAVSSTCCLTKLSGAEMVSRDMMTSCMIRPTDLHGNQSHVSSRLRNKKSVLDILDAAIDCSLHA
jgi:U-box domain